MADQDTIFDLASVLRDAIVKAFAAQQVDLPERIFVSNGEIADDLLTEQKECDGLLAVQVTRVFSGLPSIEAVGPLRCIFPNSIEMLVRLVRCVPVQDGQGQAPEATALEESAQQLLADAHILWYGTIDAIMGDKLFGACNEVTIGPLTAYGPHGGVGGWTMTVKAQL